MIVQVFGEMLYTPGPNLLGEFPSLESLKRRIIVSTKPPKEYLEGKEDKEKKSITETDSSPEDEARTIEVTDLQPRNNHNKVIVVTLSMKWSSLFLSFSDQNSSSRMMMKMEMKKQMEMTWTQMKMMKMVQ